MLMFQISNLKHHGIRKIKVPQPVHESSRTAYGIGVIVAIVIGCIVGLVILLFLILHIVSIYFLRVPP